MPKCKITVLKRTIHPDLAEKYLADASDFGPCEQFREGQEFVLESPFNVPEGFCSWAWAGMRQEILMIMSGANPPWMKRPGTMIRGCTDYLRTVIFLVERLE
jgi:uncharacterized repeat protein (TIGR04076 family)